MTPDQIVAAIALLLAEPDPAFDTLRSGGFDDRYPVTVSACPETTATLDIEGQTVICGTVSVPEDYDAPGGRRVALEFAVGRARSTNPFDDAIVYLHGGPGAGALDSIASATEVILGDHRQFRDVVTFDQRAAILSSTAIRCTETIADNMVDLVLESSGLPPIDGADVEGDPMFAPCVRELYDSGADVTAYNTENNARDVRALMSALGYPEYNILGISYGTRLALEVLRTAPEGVRAVIIDGVRRPMCCSTTISSARMATRWTPFSTSVRRNLPAQGLIQTCARPSSTLATLSPPTRSRRAGACPKSRRTGSMASCSSAPSSASTG